MALTLKKTVSSFPAQRQWPGGADGRRWTRGPSTAEAATAAEFIITMFPNTPDVEAMLFGENSVATDFCGKGELAIDMSSIAPLKRTKEGGFR